MQPHARAAVAAHALVEGGKFTGLYDHASGRHLRVAAEARGGRLQGYDGDRSARFGCPSRASGIPFRRRYTVLAVG